MEIKQNTRMPSQVPAMRTAIRPIAFLIAAKIIVSPIMGCATFDEYDNGGRQKKQVAAAPRDSLAARPGLNSNDTEWKKSAEYYMTQLASKDPQERGNAVLVLADILLRIGRGEILFSDPKAAGALQAQISNSVSLAAARETDPVAKAYFEQAKQAEESQGAVEGTSGNTGFIEEKQ